MLKKLLLGTVLAGVIALPALSDTGPVPELHWYALNVVKAQCVSLSSAFAVGVNTPADVVYWLTNNGAIVTPTVTGSSTNKTVVLDISFASGQAGEMTFFNNVKSCRLLLSQEIKNGDITPPQELR